MIKGDIITEDLFVRKFRPINFNGFLGQGHIITKIEGYVKNKSIPCIVLYGKSGLGKSTLKEIIVNEFFKQYCNNGITLSQLIERNYMEIDGSSQEKRGIGAVEILRNFCNTSPLVSPFKIFAIEEAEQLTGGFQKSLKELTGEGKESLVNIVRIIMVTNEINKINPALRGSMGGRFVEFHFKPVDWKDIAKRLWYINQLEKYNTSKEVIIKIAQLSDGSPRSALRIYDTYIKSGEIQTEEQLSYSRNPIDMVNRALEGKINEANIIMTTFLYSDGIRAFDFLRDLSSLIAKTGIKGVRQDYIGKILDKIYLYQQAIVTGGSEETILRSFIGFLVDIGYQNSLLRRSDN